MTEYWLAFNRFLTVELLKSKLRQYASNTPYIPEPRSLLYVAASSLPYHVSGYTTRTHEVIRALRAAGGKVHVLTRPGYPWDRADRRCNADREETAVQDVCYQHVRQPLNNRPVILYALQAAPVIAKIALQRHVAAIHAASNHVNALPALLAARRLGVPFQYEMRGLWELTRVSRQPDFERSQAYKQGLQLERLVARHADRLFVISEQLRNYVIENWGVDPDRINLLPNCVDPELFVPADSENVSQNTIGYAGSLIGYEGLDTLIDAVDKLTWAENAVSMVIIGDGEARSQLEAQVQRLGLSDRIYFYGKLSPEVARDMLRRCALVCIPRKPFRVCEIVPPIKLVEALAMGKPVIVPDLPVFRDELGVDPACWFFRSGDAIDLARVIEAALGDKEKLKKAGAQARHYVLEKRCWKKFTDKVVLN
ncbi:glycosyltransferase WbuB [Nitrosomonas sp. HPC101]|nr:glycosyltransferase WbuB [Nitrosomonas sp. HPC101]